MPKRDAVSYIHWFFDDIRSGTSRMSAEDFGVYVRLLNLYWTRKCKLPADDDQWLAREAGVSTRKFKSIKARLTNGDEAKFLIENGFITHERGFKSYEKSLNTMQTSQINGSKNRIKKPEKNAKSLNLLETKGTSGYTHDDTHGYSYHNHNHNKDKKEDTNVSSKKNDCDDVQHNDVDEKKAAAKNNLRGTRLNPDWSCSEGLLQAIMTRWHLSRPDIQDQETLFKDYWFGESGNRAVKRDWDAAFRVWCGRSTTSRAPPHSNSVQDQLQKQINLGSRDGWDDIDPENIVI